MNPVNATAPSGVKVTFQFHSLLKWAVFWSDATTIGSTIHLKGRSYPVRVNLGTVRFFGHQYTRHTHDGEA